MKKLIILVAAIMLTLTLTGCAKENNTLASIPTTVTVSEIDEYLGRADAQYVDLRNFDDKMKSGYISGFEFIPFFDYLEATNVLVRTDGDFTFAAEDIKNEAALRALFNEDKTIFLMCAGGTRAGFVKAALDYLGYENVINLGAFADYGKDAPALNLVAGDGTYLNEVSTLGGWTPGVYFGFDTVGKYMVTIVIGQGGGITEVLFDAVYGNSTKQDLGDAYTLGSGVTWAAEANMLAAYIVANQGWDGITFNETDFTGKTMVNVPSHFLKINQDESNDGVAGVTIGAEGFVLAWNDAIAQASDSGLGLVETAQTAAEWAAAHAPIVNYTNGTFYGYDNGYSALITISGNKIVSVYLDAIHCKDLSDPADGIKETCNSKRSYEVADYAMNYTLNDNGTPEDPSDDFYVLKDGKLDWWGQADALGAAIVKAQQWTWTLVDGDFDVDGVAGVTVGVANWEAAVNEALAQATPAN
ncbi:MAG: hypothetical protein JXR62_00940 [Bacilli bacterium]|nr:hypothetical protein [Bacilli bacterium]